MCVGMLMGMREGEGVVSIPKLCPWKDPLGDPEMPLAPPHPDHHAKPESWCWEDGAVERQLRLASWSEAKVKNMVHLVKRGPTGSLATGKFKEVTLLLSCTDCVSSAFVSIHGSNLPGRRGRQLGRYPLEQ